MFRAGTFVDTSGWIALLSVDDRLHSDAIQTWKRLTAAEERLLTTTWVLAETGNGLARSNARRSFPALVQRIAESRRIRLIEIDRDLFDRALELYSDRSDKSWGLVDCASFVCMEQHSVERSFTSDRHFEQAGFRRLLDA